MPLDAILPVEHVFLGLHAADKGQLLRDLAQRAGALLGLPAGDIAAALIAREALGSTGVGSGIAVPHAQIPGLAAPTAFFACLDRPVAFAAIDGRPVDLVFLLLSPPPARKEYLSALAAATRRLRDPRVVERLRRAATPESARAVLVAKS
jgi:PTS system nitrogen regulatory IIA component